MQITTRSLPRAWWLYLAAVVLAATALIAVGEKSVSPPSAQVVDLGASRPGSVAELSRSAPWISQVKFFDKAFFGPESNEWHDSAASGPVSEAVRQLQREPIDDRLATLWVSGPDEAVPSALKFEIHSPAISRELPVPMNTVVGPMLRDSRPIKLKMTQSAWWGLSTKAVTTEIALVPENLEYDRAVSLELSVLPESRDALGQERLHVRLQLVRFDPEQATIQSRHEAAGSSPEITSNVVQGDLAFNDLNVAHDLLITPAGRYTALIITGDGDLRKSVRCTRTDNNQQVGTYSELVPMMAVAVKSWASTKVHISVSHFGDRLHYRIVDLSANDPPAKALLLWFVAHDLTSKDIEGRVLSLPEIDQRAAWLKQAFAVGFSDLEVETTQDPAVKQLLDHLRTLP